MNKEQTKITELYDLTHTLAADYLSQFTYPWEALQGISDFIIELGNSLDENEYEKRGENIWIHKTANVFPTAFLNGPLIVGKNACLCPGQRARRRGRGCGQFHRAEKRDSVR